MTQISKEIYFKRDSGIEFTKIVIKKYGKRYQAEFYTKMAGMKTETGIAGNSIQNCIDKTEAFLQTKLLPEEICTHETK